MVEQEARHDLPVEPVTYDSIPESQVVATITRMLHLSPQDRSLGRFPILTLPNAHFAFFVGVDPSLGLDQEKMSFLRVFSEEPGGKPEDLILDGTTITSDEDGVYFVSAVTKTDGDQHKVRYAKIAPDAAASIHETFLGPAPIGVYAAVGDEVVKDQLSRLKGVSPSST